MMTNLGGIVKAVIWHHIVVVALGDSFVGNDWNDWIIIPARSGHNLHQEISGGSKNLSDFDRNSGKNVNNFGNSERMESYIMRTVNIKDNGWKQEHVNVRSGSRRFESSDDLVIPLGRAMEKVKALGSAVTEFFEENFLSNDENSREQLADSGRNIKKLKKKYKKLLFPLLVAYKLKFLALIPMLVSGLVLLVGTTGLAGFFFALFTAVMSLKSEPGVHVKKY